MQQFHGSLASTATEDSLHVHNEVELGHHLSALNRTFGDRPETEAHERLFRVGQRTSALGPCLGG
jgi:hypothetical protein